MTKRSRYSSIISGATSTLEDQTVLSQQLSIASSTSMANRNTFQLDQKFIHNNGAKKKKLQS